MPTRYLVHVRGQGLVEYALIIVFITLVVVGGLVLFGPQLSSAFRGIENNL
jgi:Flp pilus assembly pilin Flp